MRSFLELKMDPDAIFLFRVARFPNPEAPGVPGSGRNWALATAAYAACWLFWILGVFLLYELVYSFARRWRVSEFSSSLAICFLDYCQSALSSTPYTFPHLRSISFPLLLTPTSVSCTISGSLPSRTMFLRIQAVMLVPIPPYRAGLVPSLHFSPKPVHFTHKTYLPLPCSSLVPE